MSPPVSQVEYTGFRCQYGWGHEACWFIISFNAYETGTTASVFLFGGGQLHAFPGGDVDDLATHGGVREQGADVVHGV